MSALGISGHSALYSITSSAREQGRRRLEVKRFCGGQVDGQLKMEASYPAYSWHSLAGGTLPLSWTTTPLPFLASTRCSAFKPSMAIVPSALMQINELVHRLSLSCTNSPQVSH
jgi:hypothetical protein